MAARLFENGDILLEYSWPIDLFCGHTIQSWLSATYKLQLTWCCLYHYCLKQES